MRPADDDVTVFLRKAQGTKDAHLEGHVFELVKDHLKVLARSLLRGSDGDPTLQPTLLVDEAFIRLMRGDSRWENRSSFFKLAHGTMRRILSTHYRRRRPGRMDVEAVEFLVDDKTSAPSRAMEDDELLQAISGALQDFFDRGDPKLVDTFLLSFFHRIEKAPAARAVDLIPDFTGDRTPLRETADAGGYSTATAWRNLGAALEFLQNSLRERDIDG